MKRIIAIREIDDAWGDRWEVREIRPTDHGWPVYLGRRWSGGAGGKTVIPTRELVDHLLAHRRCASQANLPIGKGVLSRLRKLLGMNKNADRQAWWESHADELATMTETAFAEKHGYSPARVSQVNKAIFGKRLREPFWWLLEPACSLLLSSELSIFYIAETLGISMGSVGRLRWMVRHPQ